MERSSCVWLLMSVAFADRQPWSLARTQNQWNVALPEVPSRKPPAIDSGVKLIVALTMWPAVWLCAHVEEAKTGPVAFEGRAALTENAPS